MDEEGVNTKLLTKSKQKDVIHKVVKMTDFQFSFSPIYKKFVRELRDDNSKFKAQLNSYCRQKSSFGFILCSC